MGYEICDFLHQPNTTLVWDNEQQVPFAYRGDQWVGFDDERSLRTKVAWLKTEGFGGIMIWSVDLDDFRGYCGTGKYPLTKALVKELDVTPSTSDIPDLTKHRVEGRPKRKRRN